jgi:hypothetical protein
MFGELCFCVRIPFPHELIQKRSSAKSNHSHTYRPTARNSIISHTYADPRLGGGHFTIPGTLSSLFTTYRSIRRGGYESRVTSHQSQITATTSSFHFRLALRYSGTTVFIHRIW